MPFDVFCVALLIAFAVWGAFRGFVRQFFGLLGFAGGILLARLAVYLTCLFLCLPFDLSLHFALRPGNFQLRFANRALRFALGLACGPFDFRLAQRLTAGFLYVATNLLTQVALRFAKISAGNSHTCGLTLEGKIFCWGNGYSGQLGFGPYVQPLKPTLAVQGGLRFMEVSAGGAHTCGVTRSDLIYCWGNNSWGEIGDGTTNQALAPTLVQQ